MLRYWAHVWRAMDALEVGDFETQARDRAVQEEIAEATGQPMFHWVNTFAPALLATLAGEFELAEEITNRSAELGSEAGQPDVLAMYAAQIHVIRYEQGRLDEVLEIQEQALAETPLLDAYSSALAFSYIELEQTDKARALLRAIRRGRLRGDLDDLLRPPSSARWPRWRRGSETGRGRDPLRAAAPVARPALLQRGHPVRDDRALPRPRPPRASAAMRMRRTTSAARPRPASGSGRRPGSPGPATSGR